MKWVEVVRARKEVRLSKTKYTSLSKWGATEDFQHNSAINFVFEKEQSEEYGRQQDLGS